MHTTTAPLPQGVQVRTPTGQDYSLDLAQRVKVYRQDIAYTPSYTLRVLEAATRRALFAEDLLRTLSAAQNIRDVRTLLADTRFAPDDQADN